MSEQAWEYQDQGRQTDAAVDFISHSLEQTRRIGERLGELVAPGDVVLLEGSLGAGKTSLTQGIALGLGVKTYVTSPTFTLVNEYHGGRLPLFHVDLYRVLSLTEVDDLGLDDYFLQDGVTVVEWADRAEGLMPAQHLLVRLSFVSDTKRRVHMAPRGEHYEELVMQFKRTAFGIGG